MKISITKAVVIFVWILLWQITAMLVKIPLILPGPIESFIKLGDLLITKSFYQDVAFTLYRCIVGMGLSFLAGTGIALLAYKFKFLRSLFALPVNFLKATPVMAIIIYALLLLTANNVPIFVCFMMCFPPVYINILSGLDNISKEYLEMAQVFQLEARDKFSYVYLPSVEPEIKASFDLIAGLSWKSVVAAEVLSVPAHSMGYNLLNAKVYFETPELFAWILGIVGLAYSFEKLIAKIVSVMDIREYTGSKVFGPGAFKIEKGEKTECPYRFIPVNYQGIELVNISKSFEDKDVLKGLNFIMEAGQVTALMGPSGKGKTTLLRILAGLEKEDSGIVRNPHPTVSYLFQEDRLLPWLNVYDNLALVLKEEMDWEEADMRIKKIIKDMELEKEIYALPSHLSGGMRHRVALARALIFPTEIILMDEPFKGLDKALKERIISSCWDYYIKNRGVLLVTHQPEDAKLLASRLITLEQIVQIEQIEQIE